MSKARLKKLIFLLKINAKCIINTLIQIICIFTFAWFNDCIFEMSIIYVCFFVFRRNFEKQFHAKTTWLCTLYTIIVFYIVSLITPSKSISILLIIGFTYFINKISFYVRDYLDLKDKFKASKIEITKGMAKNKLLGICELNNLNELETNILVYFYCDRLSLTVISHKIGYSYDYVAELKSKIIRKIKN